MTLRYMTGESREDEERRNCQHCDNYRGYVCAEHRKPSPQTQLTECQLLLREACEKRYIDDDGNECEHVTSRWLNRAARAAGGE